MGYCDHTEAELRALTRERRAQRQAVLAVEPVRYSGHGYEFKPPPPTTPSGTERRKLRGARNAFWREGHHSCYYCLCAMVLNRKRLGQTQGLMTPDHITVDHKVPLSRGGTNDPSNLAPCCWRCNNDKGSLTDVEFLLILAARMVVVLSKAG